MAGLLKSHQTWVAVAAFFFAVLVTGPIGNRLWDWPHAWPWAIAGLVVALLLAGWRWRANERAAKVEANSRSFVADQARREDLRQQIALCKPAEHLQPEDLGFQRLWPDQEADPRFRPFYPDYVPRRMVPFDEVAESRTGASYDEATLREALAAGRGFVLLGPPTMGKSRTLYEVVSRLEGWTVVSPKRDRPTPPPEVFATLLAGERVVLLLEDLNDYAEATVDLAVFCGSNGLGKTQAWAVAATCRDGPELGVVREALGRSLGRFYDDIPLKLALLPQTAEEKGQVALGAGNREWDPESADNYPTPGTIVMEQALRFMRGRFLRLSPDHRDALQALKLLAEAGVLPFYQRRLQVVLERVFHRPAPHLRDWLEDLGEDAFLRRPSAQDPILAEPAYLQDAVVSYQDGRHPQDDFRQLLVALKDIDDAYGAASIGYTYAVTMNDHAQAMEAYDVARELRPDAPYILVNRAASLHALGRFEEALSDTEAALRQEPAVPEALANRGAALGDLGRYDEALADLDAAIELGGKSLEIRISRATALKALGRHGQALEAINDVLRIAPAHPGALSVRGGLSVELGRCEEALRDLDASLRLHPNHPKTNYNRGLALKGLGRLVEALEAFDESLKALEELPQVLPERFLAVYNRAMVLVALGRNEEALTGFASAVKLRPDDAPALYNRGVTLCDLGRYDEALASFSAALKERPCDPTYLNACDYALVKLDSDR